MGVSLGRAGFSVAKEFADNWQTHAPAYAEAGEVVAQVIRPQVVLSCCRFGGHEVRLA